ncbi:hypothetical protein PMZ80_006424 [Knufia obscura]|uniref:Uncharacterized protein n=2 Tax=Knufia TaxID=430999 RepID=A0AAN8ELA2_9EURO|nr:hypothetical protein PMZ80_006424 [Knufia obscura]KAK5953427.1 hypothetical protein OHC33_005371 [Knufia fluminis]
MNPDTSFVTKGSLCAYAEEAGVMYSCPAGDPYCWNQGGPCSGGSDIEAGPNETACSDIGSGTVNWCCNSQFGNCTQTLFQQNNCWSWFDNPNRNVNIPAASASASSVMQMAVSQPTVTNIVVQALAGGGWVPSAVSTTPSASESTATALSTESTSTDVNQPSTSTTDSAPTSAATTSSSIQASPLSAGAIAGIVVGAAVAACISTILFFQWRRRQQNKRSQAANLAPVERSGDFAPPSVDHNSSFIGQTSELSSDQGPSISDGKLMHTMELDGAAVPKPAFEKGCRDSRQSRW